MLPFLAARIFWALGAILASSALCYGLIYLAPSDPATMIVAGRIGGFPSEKQVQLARTELGLDKPVIVQYGAWLARAVQGDLGRSIRTGEPVAQEFGSRIGMTAILALTSTLLTVLIGLPLGVLGAARAGSRTDRTLRLTSMLAVSAPDFWLAFVLILVFSVNLRWLPTYGAGDWTAIILPAVTLATARIATLSRLTRSSLRELRGQDYLRTATAKGASSARVWWRHALPNAGAPILTVVAAQLAAALTGTVVIETVFAWPGIGNFYLDAVQFRDLPVIQAGMLLFCTAFVAVNLLVDFAYVALDPRLRETA